MCYEVCIKVVFLKPWQLAPDSIYYYENNKKKEGFSPHFQEDSNALKYVLIEYYMNKLWIFLVWSIASPKT
jgi:hypothetical protein